MMYCKIGFGKKVHIIEFEGWLGTWTLCRLREYHPLTVVKPKDDEQLCKNCVRIQGKDDRGL